MDRTIDSPPRTSAAAVWSVVLGILSMFCLWLLGSIPAIILGIIALRNIDAQPKVLGGRAVAISGIVTGSIGILTGLFAVGLVASLTVPAFNGITETSRRTKEMAEVRMLLLGCRSYAVEREGIFPNSLEELYPEYLENEELFEAKGNRPPRIDAYLYRPGLVADPLRQPVILGPERRGYRTLGYTDSSVEMITEPLPDEVMSDFR